MTATDPTGTPDVDDPSTREWEPFEPAVISRTLQGLRGPWWIAGGRALELFLGRPVREHSDVDVAVLREDQSALYRALGGWDLRYAMGDRGLVPWDGRPLQLPVHAIWARRRSEGPWLCEFLLNEAAGDHWVFRRNPSVTYPLGCAGLRTRDGVPILTPEIVLLYKAKRPGPKTTSISRPSPRGWESGSAIGLPRPSPGVIRDMHGYRP